MKTSLPGPELPPNPRSKAWSCLVTNLLVLPGLGSVMAGFKSGYVQMFLALAGFLVTLVALIQIVLAWAREFLLPDNPRLYESAIGGMAVFLLGWVWSLLTSLILFRKKT